MPTKWIVVAVRGQERVLAPVSEPDRLFLDLRTALAGPFQPEVIFGTGYFVRLATAAAAGPVPRRRISAEEYVKAVERIEPPGSIEQNRPTPQRRSAKHARRSNRRLK